MINKYISINGLKEKYARIFYELRSGEEDANTE